MLSEMGYEMTDTPDEADFILFNTCAVREHAEDRAFGNIGALRHLKKERPDIVIAMCGCMAQQEKNVEKIKKSYPQDKSPVRHACALAISVAAVPRADREKTRI